LRATYYGSVRRYAVRTTWQFFMYPRITDLFQDLFGFNLPLPIYSFGFMVATAIVIAAVLSKGEFDRMYGLGQLSAVQIKEKDKKGREKMISASPSALIWTMMLIAAGVGIAGSKLFHIIDHWDRFVVDPLGLIFNPAGLTFYGGLISATVVLYFYSRSKGLSFSRIADGVAPGLILAYGIGRIGCYLAGDGDWGTCSSLSQKPGWIPDFLWSESFPRNILEVDVGTWVPAGGKVCELPPEIVTGAYPTMLYETMMAIVIFAILWRIRKHPFKAGWLFSVYLVFNGIERFLIEIIRLNPNNVFGLSQAQLIAIVLTVVGLIGLAATSRKQPIVSVETDSDEKAQPEPKQSPDEH